MIKLNLVSGNANKIKEIKAILGDNFEIITHKLDLTEIQGSLEEIAEAKCRESLKYINPDQPLIVEDTGIGFDALGGLPGPYVKWFLKKIGIDGLVKMLSPYENKGVTGICVCACYFPKTKEIKLFTGESHGTIVEPRGDQTFGFDPIFQPDGYDKTYGQLGTSVKNTISHRSLALAKLREYLLQI